MDIYLFSDLNSAHLKTLTSILNQTYWGKDMTYSQLYTTVSNSSKVFAYKNRDNELVAFTRVLTDYVFKAMVFDFVVADQYKGKGIGKKLLSEVINCPDFRNVESIELYCTPDVVPFYSQLGFKTVDQDLLLMSRAPEKSTTRRPIQSV